jgi:hypothetical protein
MLEMPLGEVAPEAVHWANLNFCEQAGSVTCPALDPLQAQSYSLPSESK